MKNIAGLTKNMSIKQNTLNDRKYHTEESGLSSSCILLVHKIIRWFFETR